MQTEPQLAIQAGAPVAGTPEGDPAERMLAGIGKLTRSLHSSLRELGYDRMIEEAASAIPDARDRLAYVASMTEQAAQRALNATELAKPIQDALASDARSLSALWAKVLARESDLAGFRELVLRTQGYLEAVPVRTGATNAQLMEIMMAQDFQDLTGQVIKKVTELIHLIEGQLVQLLVENTPPERRSVEAVSLLNGPVVNVEKAAGAVTSQQQVDDLLDSLGF